MQRRLTVALVGIALAAVVLVGAGVLVLAQFGARAQTEAELNERLTAASSVIGEAGLGPGLRTTDRLRVALQVEQLVVVAVDGEGNLRPLASQGPRGRTGDGSVLAGDRLQYTLDGDRYARYLDGETVTDSLRGPGLDTVVGLRRIDASDEPDSAGLGEDATLGVLATKSVVAVNRSTRAWFALSATAVLGLSAVVAWLLARKFSHPLRAIEAVTASVAAGDFTARVDVDGDDEVAMLGRSVNRMAADLERSKALDQQFLMSVSHDLRTPLTAIAGYAEALSDGAVDDPARAGQIIANHADRLERLVGDLLDLARLDANRFRLHPRPFDLAVVVGRTVAGLAPRAEQYGLVLDHQAPPTLAAVADPDRVAQVVGNLVDNALKFAATRVTVTLGAEAPAGTGPEPMVRLEVFDDGPGIPAQDLPHVFERLYVSSAQPARAENPSGMGLAIVRELASAMGGTVRAASGPDGGTRISVLLPLRPPDPPG